MSGTVGIDVGGTGIKAGAADPSGHVLAELELPTGARDDSDALLDRIARAARELGCRERLGVGVPGLIEHETGTVRSNPNLPALVGVCVPAELARRLDLAPDRVRLGNDADLAALGESWIGAMRGVRNAMMLTLGTGIGGGLVLDGQPFTGCGMAGEPGHLVVEPDGLPCGCGSRGCLETLASASAAARRARQRGLPPHSPGDVPALCAAARAGPGPERELLREIGVDLGHGLALVVSLLDLRCFVFGGGFSPALPELEPGIRAGLAERSFGPRLAEVELRPAELGPRAGWMGAARLAMLANDRRREA